VLKRLIGRYPYQLKFVISDPGDLTEVRVIVAEIEAARDRVLADARRRRSGDTSKRRARWLVDYLQAGRVFGSGPALTH